MNKRFIISIDLGTTGNRVYCFNESGKPISSAYSEFKQIFPKAGWVEHDPVEIWESVKKLIPEALAKGNLEGKNALAIGITNQRETSLIWNRENGMPLYNAIVWQCRRTADICSELKKNGYENIFREKTGLVLDAYFSGTKIKWILDNIKDARTLAREDKIVFGTIDTWILWNLTGGKSFSTDYTNASRTLIFDIKKKCWSEELLDILNIPKNILPEVMESSSDFGATLNVPGLPDGIIIGGIAGDQQAAMAGQNCVFESTSKNTYGTGCFMLLNTGNNPVVSKKGLLTTLACDNFGKPVYALEGSVFIGGAVVQWLRDYMKFCKESRETEDMALSVTADDEVVFVPAFVGLGAPYWKMDARGAIFGLTRDTSVEQIVRAAIKSIAFQSMDVIKVLEEDSGMTVKELKVDGGAVKNKYLMQFQSDILGIPLLVPEIIESTALGAAYLSGITAGIYKSIDEIAQYNKISARFNPKITDTEKNRQLNLWKEAINRLL